MNNNIIIDDFNQPNAYKFKVPEINEECIVYIEEIPSCIRVKSYLDTCIYKCTVIFNINSIGNRLNTINSVFAGHGWDEGEEVRFAFNEVLKKFYPGLIDDEEIEPYGDD